MKHHNIEEGTVASAAFLMCFFREIVRNYWSIGRGIFSAESDLSGAALATLL